MIDWIECGPERGNEESPPKPLELKLEEGQVIHWKDEILTLRQKLRSRANVFLAEDGLGIDCVTKFPSTYDDVVPLRKESRVLRHLGTGPRIHSVPTDVTDVMYEGFSGIKKPLVHGTDLQAKTKDDVLSIPDLYRVGREVACALAHIHSAGVLHWDIKPANIVDRYGSIATKSTIALIDFGFAGFFDEKPANDGRIRGSPWFIPSEVYHTGLHTVQSNLYALGMSLYMMATGKRPFNEFEARSPNYYKVHKDGTLIDPRVFRQDMPDDMAHIIVRLLARNPSDRHESAKELEADLRN